MGSDHDAIGMQLVGQRKEEPLCNSPRAPGCVTTGKCSNTSPCRRRDYDQSYYVQGIRGEPSTESAQPKNTNNEVEPRQAAAAWIEVWKVRKQERWAHDRDLAASSQSRGARLGCTTATTDTTQDVVAKSPHKRGHLARRGRGKFRGESSHMMTRLPGRRTSGAPRTTPGHMQTNGRLPASLQQRNRTLCCSRGRVERAQEHRKYFWRMLTSSSLQSCKPQCNPRATHPLPRAASSDPPTHPMSRAPACHPSGPALSSDPCVCLEA